MESLCKLLQFRVFRLDFPLLASQILSELLKLSGCLGLRITFLLEQVLVLINHLLHLFCFLCHISFLPALLLDVRFILLNQTFLLLDHLIFRLYDTGHSLLFRIQKPYFLVLIPHGHLSIQLRSLELFYLLLQFLNINFESLILILGRSQRIIKIADLIIERLIFVF